ncbi:cobalt-precorrin-6A reductase [Rhodococcus sp. UNC363MFTsu5.1]|uniref:cobalt-precorrin-6A reductase n=1 Tax=Rhodococcus sp. UNC363MFTsu5.1 TaxID=1449069 RepID=UPI000A9533EF|nr:cobalt-precorrin-6A reductase [Rhodococcus sp. UNC363MFTsu5.1]
MAPTMRVLILGGTAEARSLAARLSGAPDVEVVSSLAGRVRDPRLPEGEVRIGGFGGATGLQDWLRDNAIRAVLDATHPFAARISGNAAAATTRSGLPFAVVQRPPWSPRPGDNWLEVDSLEAAAAALPDLGRRVFLTIGRQGVDRFATVDADFLVRAIDPPEGPTPARMTLLLDRGPFEVGRESALLREHDIDVLVSKNSGGDLTVAKLTAARELGVPVVMIRRPPNPLGATVFDGVDEAERWLLAVLD